MAVILWDDAVRLALQGVCSNPRCGVWAAGCGSTHGAGLALRLPGSGSGSGSGQGQGPGRASQGRGQGDYGRVEAAAVRTWPARHRWSRDRSAPRLESSERQCSICRLVASSSSSSCTSGKGAALPLGGLAEAMAATFSDGRARAPTPVPMRRWGG